MPLRKKNNTTLKIVSDKLLSKHHEHYYVDITVPEAKKAGLFVVKVIVPKLQPLYLDEGYPYLGGERLRQIPLILDKQVRIRRLNNVPHPFL